MEYARDLGEVELWEESLRRSLERRGRPRRSSVELHRLRPARDLTLGDVIERSAYYSQLRRQAAARPAMPRPSAALGGVSALALLTAATVPKLLGGGGASAHRRAAALREAAATNPLAGASPTVTAHPVARPVIQHPVRAARAAAQRAQSRPPAAVHAAPPTAASAHPAAPATHVARAADAAPRATIASAHPGTTVHTSGGAGLTGTPEHSVAKPRVKPAHHAPTVPPRHTTTVTHTSGGVGIKAPATHPTTHPSGPTVAPVSSAGYVDPLAHASVTPERIDQGVDYSGSGTLTALGAGRVTYVGTSGTGWPGAFIEYRLASGADAGRYVYYAEGVSPLVHVGESLRPGQAVARLIPGYSDGIEIGWGSGLGTQPLAQALGQWGSGSDAANVATPAGRSFSALIASLGGPPGKVEG